MENMEKLKRSTFKSIVRVEAFGLLALIVSLILFYVFFLMEFHLKWILEKTAFESVGSEVNVSSLDISFAEPHIKITRIQVTNPDKPKENVIEIGSVLVTFEYAPLLKGSFVSELTNVEGIRFHTERSFKGRVLPKDQRILVLKDPSQNKVHDLLEDKFNKTAFSDLAGLFSKDKREDIERDYKEKLKTLKISDKIKTQAEGLKGQIADLEKEVESKEVKSLINEAKSFKFKSGSTAESIASASEALKLIKKLKNKKKEIKQEIANIKKNAKSIKTDVKSSPQKFMKDIKGLKTALDPKQLSADKISEDILSEYFSVQLTQVGRAANSLKKQALGSGAEYVDLDSKREESIAADEETEQTSQMGLEKAKEQAFKEQGKTFIFVKEKVLPQYWFKKIAISSKASSGQDFGDVNGLIENFSAAPELLDKVMTVDIKGSVPKQGIGAFSLSALVDHRNLNQKKERASVDISDYLVKGLELFEGSDEWVKILKSNARTNLSVNMNQGLIDLNLNQTLRSPSYEVFSKDKYVKNLMNGLKDSKEDLSFSLKAQGDISSPKLRISSNLGDILLRLIKKNLSNAVNGLAQEHLSKINNESLKKLSPYLKDIDVTSLKAADLGNVFEQEIEKALSKLKIKNKSNTKDDLKKELLDKLFKKL